MACSLYAKGACSPSDFPKGYVLYLMACSLHAEGAYSLRSQRGVFSISCPRRARSLSVAPKGHVPYLMSQSLIFSV